MNAVEIALVVHDALEGLGLPHAVGGALCLGYYADPRGTLDADVNVFAPFTDAPRIVAALEAHDLRPDRPPEQWMPAAGIRLREQGTGTAVDLFLDVDDRYADVAGRCRTVPFGADSVAMPILAPEDLVVFKLSFNRPKDWVDVAEIARTVPSLDVEQIEDLLVDLRGPTMHPRLARLRTMVRRAAEERQD